MNSIEKIDQYIGINTAYNDQKMACNDLKHLNTSIYHFMMRVPFENIDVQNDIPISTNINDLYQKIIIQKRGGYCYELNTFFKYYLTEKGYNVTTHSATVITDKGRSKENSHMLNVTYIHDQPYVTDVGFGDLPTQAIPIAKNPNIVHDDTGDFRAIMIDDVRFNVQKRNEDTFVTLYESSLIPKTLDDFKTAIEYNQHNENSIFVKKLLITKPYRQGRVTMTESHLTISARDDKTIIDITKQNYLNYLNDIFDLNVKINRLEQ